MQDLGQLAKPMAEVAASLEAPADLDTVLHQITEAAVDALPPAVAASISVTTADGAMETLAPTVEWVNDLDALQYRLRQGPCYAAATDGAPVLGVEVMTEEARWPDYARQAAEWGVGSQIAFRLDAGDGQHGALNVYATTPRAFDPDTRYLGELFATEVGLVLGWSRREESLHEALSTRKVIGQAIGIVMERYQLDEDVAFRYLVRLSQHTNTKLRLIATDLVARVNQSHR